MSSPIPLDDGPPPQRATATAPVQTPALPSPYVTNLENAPSTPIADSERTSTTDKSSHNHSQAAAPSTKIQDESGDAEKNVPLTEGEEEANLPPNDGKIQGRTKLQITIIMVSLCLATYLAALDVTIITTALPTISEALGSAEGYTWIGSAFLLANAGSIPVFGKVSDIFGRKVMLLLANVVFMVGSLVAGLASSIGMLIAARAVQGIGAGGLTVLVNIVIGDLFPLRLRSTFYGIVGGVWAIAATTGPIIGGALTQRVSWRWCFYLNLPVDCLAFFIILFFLDIHIPHTPLLEGLKAVDWVGALTCVGGTLMLLFGLQYGGISFPWDSATVVCLLVFGIVALILFGVWEYKAATYPILPMDIFSSITNSATLLIVFLHSFVFIAASYYLPLYFQAIKGLSPILSGVVFLPMAVSVAFGSMAAGIIMSKTGRFLVPIYACFVMMALGFGLFIDLNASTGWAKIVIYQLIAGCGVGLGYQTPYIALQAHTKPRDIASATATLGFANTLATSVGVVIGQVVYLNQLAGKTATLEAALGPTDAAKVTGAANINTAFIAQLPQPQKRIVKAAFASSLQTMWIVYCAFAAFGLLASLLIKDKKLTNEHQETVTGLETERENAAARAEEKQAKKAAKQEAKLAKLGA